VAAFKKAAQNFAPLEPWALSATTPMAQHKKVFVPLFSKSGHFLTKKARLRGLTLASLQSLRSGTGYIFSEGS
jgi:hypothetical protein